MREIVSPGRNCSSFRLELLWDGPKLEHDGRLMEQDGPKLERDGPVMEQDGPKLERDGPVMEHPGREVERDGVGKLCSGAGMVQFPGGDMRWFRATDNSGGVG